MAVGGLEYCIMPLLLGGMATYLAFNEFQVGAIGAAYMAGYTLSSFTAVFWSYRISWRKATLLSAASVAALYGVFLFSKDFLLISSLMFFIGIARAVIYSISLCGLGETKNPERSYALGSLVTFILGGVGMFALPYLTQQWRLYGLIVPIIVISVMAGAINKWLPVGGTRQDTLAENTPSGKFSQVLLPLLGLLAFWIGMSGIWAFLERIGNAGGLSPQAIGTILSIGYAAVIIAAFLAAWLGDRIGSAIPIIIGVAVMLLGIFYLRMTLTFNSFLVFSILFQAGWALLYPYTMAVINAADTSGRFVSLIATAQGLGASIGSGLAGIIVTHYGYDGIYLMGFVCLGVFLLIYAWTLYKQKTHTI